MNIGFVSTWFERGAAYVTRQYVDALRNEHNVYVYARGGEQYAKGNPDWDLPYVTWGLRLTGTDINFRHFKKWIIKNNIEVIFFNEQHEHDIVAVTKRYFPSIKMGSYIDYYTENTVQDFQIYDFLICNTRRHYSVFSEHPQCYYVPWGTDIELFRPQQKESDLLTFFHSAGMSKRKGTNILVEAFIRGELYRDSKLIIHSQLDVFQQFGYSPKVLKANNIEVIEKTVSAPGLYHLGDVYVYPTTLDGLGLTMYEALSCGLPVVTTDCPPMNEVVNKDVGYLVNVEKLYCRNDGYYWPVSLVSEDSLIEAMRFYVENQSMMETFKNRARSYAEDKLDWKARYQQINEIFLASELLDIDVDLHIDRWKKYSRKNTARDIALGILPDRVIHWIKSRM